MTGLAVPNISNLSVSHSEPTQTSVSVCDEPKVGERGGENTCAGGNQGICNNNIGNENMRKDLTILEQIYYYLKEYFLNVIDMFQKV